MAVLPLLGIDLLDILLDYGELKPSSLGRNDPELRRKVEINHRRDKCAASRRRPAGTRSSPVGSMS